MEIKKFYAKVGSICLAIILLVSIGLFGWAGDAGAKTIKIGSVWGLSGPGAQIQIIMKNGEQLCKDWINGKGGIDVKGEKYTIEIITEDIKNTVEGCVTAANKLVYQDKVKFVLGLTTPFLVEAVASVTEPNKVCYFSGTHDTLSPDYPYTVSAYIAYASPKPVLYDYLVKTYPEAKKIAFTEIDDPAVQRAANVARKEMKKYGLIDVGRQVYPFGAQDYYPILNKILTLKPDAIDMNMEWPPGAATLVKQARELGFSGPILGNSPWDPNFIRDTIGNKEFATDFIWPVWDPKSAAGTLPAFTKEIMKLYEDTHKTPFVIDSLRGWDPLYTLVQAIEAAQSLNPGDVIKAFENMKTIECSVGTAKVGGLKTYGVNHMVVQPLPLTRLKNGEIEFIKWTELDIP